MKRDFLTMSNKLSTSQSRSGKYRSLSLTYGVIQLFSLNSSSSNSATNEETFARQEAESAYAFGACATSALNAVRKPAAIRFRFFRNMALISIGVGLYIFGTNHEQSQFPVAAAARQKARDPVSRRGLNSHFLRCCQNAGDLPDVSIFSKTPDYFLRSTYSKP
jgi:hypothetical protein